MLSVLNLKSKITKRVEQLCFDRCINACFIINDIIIYFNLKFKNNSFKLKMESENEVKVRRTYIENLCLCSY